MRTGLAYAADAMHLDDISEGSAEQTPGTVWIKQGEQTTTIGPEAIVSTSDDSAKDVEDIAELPAVVAPSVPRYARPKEARPRTIKFLHIFRNEPRCEMVATNRFSQSEAVMPCRDATSWDT